MASNEFGQRSVSPSGHSTRGDHPNLDAMPRMSPIASTTHVALMQALRSLALHKLRSHEPAALPLGYNREFLRARMRSWPAMGLWRRSERLIRLIQKFGSRPRR